MRSFAHHREMNLLRRTQLEESGNGPTRDRTDDIVYPLYLLDQAQTLRSIIVACTLRFDSVLDPGRLKSSLPELLSIGDWRKLGGRLKQNVSLTFCLHRSFLFLLISSQQDGSLELHSPEEFLDERPAFAYCHAAFDVSINHMT